MSGDQGLLAFSLYARHCLGNAWADSEVEALWEAFTEDVRNSWRHGAESLGGALYEPGLRP